MKQSLPTIFLLLLLAPAVAWAADLTLYAKPIPGIPGANHLFIVYTDDEGLRYAYRGGPSNTDPNLPAVSLAGSLGIDTAQSAGFGNVQATVEPYRPGHPDWNYTETAWPSTVLSYGSSAGPFAQTWRSLQSVAETINNVGFAYNPATNNSNTTVFVGLQGAGLPQELPVSAATVPGYGHSLTTESSVLTGGSGTAYDGISLRSLPPAPIGGGQLFPQRSELGGDGSVDALAEAGFDNAQATLACLSVSCAGPAVVDDLAFVEPDTEFAFVAPEPSPDVITTVFDVGGNPHEFTNLSSDKLAALELLGFAFGSSTTVASSFNFGSSDLLAFNVGDFGFLSSSPVSLSPGGIITNPEPSTVLLLGTGLLLMIVFLRKRPKGARV